MNQTPTAMIMPAMLIFVTVASAAGDVADNLVMHGIAQLVNMTATSSIRRIGTDNANSSPQRRTVT